MVRICLQNGSAHSPVSLAWVWTGFRVQAVIVCNGCCPEKTCTAEGREVRHAGERGQELPVVMAWLRPWLFAW